MNYPEFVRARIVVSTFALVGLAVALLSAIAHWYTVSYLPPGTSIEIISIGDPAGAWPLSRILGVCAIPVAILVTIFGASLNRLREYGDTVLTFPVSRITFALGILGTDVAALIGAFAISLVAFGILPTMSHQTLQTAVVDPLFGPRLLLYFGALLFWFGLIQGVGAWIPVRASWLAGLTWPFFLILLTLDDIKHVWWHPAVHALNQLNPLATLFGGGHVSLRAMGDFATAGLPVLEKASLIWLLAIAMLAVSVAGWQRQEA